MEFKHFYDILFNRNILCANTISILGASNRLYLYLISILLAEFCSTTLAAAQGWSAEIFGGTAWSLPQPLHIEQPNELPLRFCARYSTRPWKGSPYYAYRIGYQRWSVELVHHKLYLENPPPEVQHFEVSHGYNLVMLNRALTASPLTIRLGLGSVVAHPEGEIRGQAVGPVSSLLGGGYYICGISFQLAVSRHLEISKHWFITPEAKFTAAWTRVPLAGGGQAEIPNLALHVLTGIGFRTGDR